MHTPQEALHRLCPDYATEINSPLRHVRTRVYFTSESHMHSLINVLRFCTLGAAPAARAWQFGIRCPVPPRVSTAAPWVVLETESKVWALTHSPCTAPLCKSAGMGAG